MCLDDVILLRNFLGSFNDRSDQVMDDPFKKKIRHQSVN
jgi:hypothetical protein